MEVSIEDIKKNLTGDLEKDREYLMNLIEELKNSQNVQLFEQVTELLYNTLNEDEKKEVEKNVNNEVKNYTENLIKVDECFQKGNLEEGKKLLLPLIENFKDLENNYDNEKYIFKEFSMPFEYLLFNKIKKDPREIKPLPLPIARAYALYGYLLNEEKKYDEADKYLKKALDLAPLNFDYIFESIENYRLKGDLESYFEASKSVLPIVYLASQAARCYLNIAYYYKAKKDYKTTIALLSLVFQFEHDNQNREYIKENISKIKKLSKEPIDFTTFEETVKILNDNNILLVPSSTIGKAYEEMINEYKNSNDLYALLVVLEAKVKFIATKEEKELYKQVIEKLAKENDNKQ